MVSKKVSPTKDAVYQLKITLCPRDIRPPIWRRILVPASTSLGLLHETIQIVFGWTDSHLHLYECDEGTFSDPYMEVDGTRDESKVRIGQVLKREKAKIRYEYDFGDGWDHEIVLEKILEPYPGKFRPVCVAGKRACPPEDCGSVPGYYNLCEAMKDPKHPDREDLLEWLGDVPYDPEAFDLDKINEILKGEE